MQKLLKNLQVHSPNNSTFLHKKSKHLYAKKKKKKKKGGDYLYSKIVAPISLQV